MTTKSLWSWKIGRIAGIDISVHLTFLILLVFMLLGGLGNTLFFIGIFGCVLLHELGHALAARHFGIQTRGIVLLPIGGVAQLERMPRNPWQELIITIAGPAVNFALAGLFLALIVIFAGLSSLSGLNLLYEGTILQVLFGANIVLGVFNLLPAFPMDGGRILRALLAMKLDYLKATALAATVGQVLAVGLGILGLFTQPMLVFVAIFIFLAAGQELQMVRMEHAARRYTGSGHPQSAAINMLHLNDLIRRQLEEIRRRNGGQQPSSESQKRSSPTREPRSDHPGPARDVPFTID